jgi:hypothetical protein
MAEMVIMTNLGLGTSPRVPPQSDAAVVAWMGKQGWTVAPARSETDSDSGFYVWQEDEPKAGRSHALWISEPMVRHLPAERLIQVLNSEDMAEELRISFKISIQERGDGYRVSIVPRASGEHKRLE